MRDKKGTYTFCDTHLGLASIGKGIVPEVKNGLRRRIWKKIALYKVAVPNSRQEPRQEMTRILFLQCCKGRCNMA